MAHAVRDKHIKVILRCLCFCRDSFFLECLCVDCTATIMPSSVGEGFSGRSQNAPPHCALYGSPCGRAPALAGERGIGKYPLRQPSAATSPKGRGFFKGEFGREAGNINGFSMISIERHATGVRGYVEHGVRRLAQKYAINSLIVRFCERNAEFKAQGVVTYVKLVTIRVI